MSAILVWLRNDLRLHDHPALQAAIEDGDTVVPLFIFDTSLLEGKHSSPNRSRFLLECLADLRQSLQALGANLVVRSGDPVNILGKLARECEATTVHYSEDYTPYAIQRDRRTAAALQQEGIALKAFPGRLIVNSFDTLRTKTNQTYKVFTPFWRTWQQVPRREALPKPTAISFPSGLSEGVLPELPNITQQADLSPDALPGGEAAGRKRFRDFISHDIERYHELHNSMGRAGTSRISAYLHFGCLSPREIETMLPDNEGASAWHRQLAWRDFYNYVLFHFPTNVNQEFQERYRKLTWEKSNVLLTAWKKGHTGYPVVDAAMRQLLQEGWMHNRARLIVGSFLTKDLGIDWREGEAHFMRWLIDGDTANNNGNWQWIASVGVDPAPLFRRLYNPTSQQKAYDPDGDYIRRYVPELKHVPQQYIAEPWTMSLAVQKASSCSIGDDYPLPIVDHSIARQTALERYKGAF